LIGTIIKIKKFLLEKKYLKKIKNTLGITALLFWIVHIDKIVCDLDVEFGISFLGRIKKRKIVHLLNYYMI